VRKLRIVGLALLFSWVVLLLVYYVGVFLDKYEVEKNTSIFLDSVIARNVNAAPDFALSRTEQEKVKKHIEEDGFGLIGYERITSDFSDGCVCTGHVDLILQATEQAMKVSAVFTVKEGNKPNQICIYSPPGVERGSIPVIAKWNEFACGADF
jgi:hypothetical protein